MFDRSVISKRDPDSVPLSKQQIDTLKLKVVSSESAPVPVQHKLTGFLQSILSFFSFGVGGGKRQCKTYGHVLSTSAWTSGERPRCCECGRTIKDPSELRRSEPRRF